MIYTVTFNPALDYVVQMDRALQLDAVNRCAGEDIQWGGKGINVSCVLRELGYDSVALGFVAGFTGQALEGALTDAGVRCDFVRLEAGLTRINVKIKADSETEINASGPAIPPAAVEALYQKLDALPAGSVLVLAGSIPPSLAPDSYEKILARLAGRNTLCVVDAASELLVNVLKYQPFLIKPNQQELSEIAGRPLTTDAELAAGAAALQAQGAHNVLVSMAGAGALLLDESGSLHRISAPQGRVINSVGAGDSMVAGFLAGYLATHDHEQALRLATAAGSATAFCLGLADKAAIETVLETMK